MCGVVVVCGVLTLMVSVSLSPCASCMALSIAFSSRALISPLAVGAVMEAGTAGDDEVGDGSVSVDMLE